MAHSTRGISRSVNAGTVLLPVILFCGLLTACGDDGFHGDGFRFVAAQPPMVTKGLWIANGTNVLEYVPSQLAVAGTSAAAPHLMNTSGSFGAPQGVTFDAKGNLWVMDPEAVVNGAKTPALLEFSPAQLAALGTTAAPDPTATITSTALSFPQQSVFDGQGNQWVTDHNNNSVLVFTAAQLSQTGVNNVVPAVTITSAAFNGPLGIAFDRNGDLWIANNGGVPGAGGAMSAAGTTIVEFLAAHLQAPPATGVLTPDLTPDVTLSDDGQNSIQAPWALVFDYRGHLLSSNANPPFTVVDFSRAELAATGAPVPVLIVSPTTLGGIATLNAPNGICFDNLEDLAVMNSGGAFGIAFFSDNQMVNGAFPPNTFIVGGATNLNAPAGCNFGPLVN
jgi:hypothetical protein